MSQTDRDGNRHREKQRVGQTERQRQEQTLRETESQTDRDRNRHTQRQRVRQTDRHRNRQRDLLSIVSDSNHKSIFSFQAVARVNHSDVIHHQGQQIRHHRKHVCRSNTAFIWDR